MKKIAKIASLLVCFALLISIIPFNAEAAKPKDYVEFELVAGDVWGGVYKEGLDGPFDTKYFEAQYPEKAEALLPLCMIDNDLENSFWSKPIKFVDLYDEEGTWIPAIEVNLTRDGKPAENVGAFKYWVRDMFDCLLTHFAIQVATDAAKTQWVTVYEEGGNGVDAVWDDYPMTFYFDPVTAYAIRIIAFNIDEPNYTGDRGLYDTLEGDDTRLCCSELRILIYNGSENPTEPEATEPKATEPKATEPKATDPNATEPTEDPNATEPTEDPNATEPTEDPNATEPTEDPNATEPTEDPNATEPTEDPNATEPTEDPNATEPEATGPANDETQAPTDAPATNNDAKEEPKSNAGLIIGIIAGVLVIAAVVFFVIKKKK